MNIVHTNDLLEAHRLVATGHTPIECSLGGESVVDDLQMDHHGNLSDLEGVAVRAWRDHYGVRGACASFVVTGSADADATFAIACLAGVVPETHTKINVDILAAIINRMDTHPFGVNLSKTPEGRLLLLWNQLTGGLPESALSFYTGIGLWVRLLTGRPPTALLDATGEEESRRVADARASLDKATTYGRVLFVQSPVWGFDQWYSDSSPCVVALTPGRNVTIGCRSLADAEALFGPGGLKNVWPLLDEKILQGWGGRETIGGSPRGAAMFVTQGRRAAALLNKLAKPCS